MTSLAPHDAKTATALPWQSRHRRMPTLSVSGQRLLMASALVAFSTPGLAQQAGTWSVSAGVTRIAPSVDSGSLSAPSGNGVIPDAKVDVSSSTQLTAALNYMATDHLNLHLPLGTGFRHDVSGAGVLAGVGKVADTRALPITLIAQYRFLNASARFRPYLGAGLSYVRFYGERGSATLTSLTNPGGPPTGVSFKSKWAPTLQVGGVLNLDAKWFLEASYAKTFLKTRGTLSTNQTIDVGLDPNCFTLQLGYKF
ncbi:MAG: OmpW family outer membrane protein [Polaromonas sp.]